MTTDSPRARVGERLATGGLVALAGFTALFKVFDYDVYWHVATGRWIWAHHAFPTRDVFSHTAPGPLLYTEGIAQLVFFGFDKLGGGTALTWAGVLLASSLAWATIRSCAEASRASVSAKLMAVAWTMLIVAFRFGPKTEGFSFVAFALLLVMIHRKERAFREGRRGWKAHAPWLAGLAALGLLWGNCHRGGAFAPVALAAAGLGWSFDRETRRLAPVAFAGAALIALALTINTAGVRYFVSSLDVASRESLREYVPQHRPITWSFFRDHDRWALAAAVTWGVVEAARRKIDARLAVALASVSLPLTSVRYLPFAAIAVTPALADGLEITGRRGARLLADIRPAIRSAALATVVTAVMVLHYATAMAPSAHGFGLLAWRLPVDAAEFVRRAPPPGPMWNSYDFGGYLIYALGPAHPDFIDGRMDTVYPNAFFVETMRAHDDPATLERQLADHHIGFAVVTCSKLTETRFPTFFRDPQWQLAYFDDVAAVAVRRTPESASYLERVGYRALNPANAIARAAQVAVMPTDSAERGLFEEEAARNLNEAPGSIRAHVVWSILLRGRGDLDGARAHDDLAREMARDRGIELR